MSTSKVFEVQIHDEENVLFLYRKSLGEADYAQQANSKGLKTPFVQFPKMALSYARREQNRYFACTLEMKDRCSSPTIVTSTASASSSMSALVLRLDFKVKVEGADIPLLNLELKQATSDTLINHLCSVYEDTKQGRDADVCHLRSELHQVREELSEAQSALHAVQAEIQTASAS
ncbi:hypothetical protein AAVH_37575 [Aphelenchoides avenae]|nr:hypothetical protein AAVH_37575 [Aphelenchus avenae]